MGGPGGGGSRPAVARARRPARRPPHRLAGLRPLPCLRDGIHASAIVEFLMLCISVSEDTACVVYVGKIVRARNAARI